ncbi:pyridoxamine 5'-phosphate oxidase family protein [Streptodolium elevatio]|uniref:Pyridoxamine 5'-phosphate oxidase family protein n=1 Tax=Streptodolium elevatio TaxID=3157996 RepID=A0ABV3DH22_9ACTN
MSQTLADLQDRTFAKATPATDSTYPPERRLTAGQLAAYLDRRTYAVVGTARPDGRPHAAMSMYVRRGTTFWLPTVSGSVRARNLREQPWLTLVVAEADGDAHIVVILEGPTETLPLEDAPEDVRAVVEGDWPRAWIRLRAERLLSYAAEDAKP